MTTNFLSKDTLHLFIQTRLSPDPCQIALRQMLGNSKRIRCRALQGTGTQASNRDGSVPEAQAGHQSRE